MVESEWVNVTVAVWVLVSRYLTADDEASAAADA